MQKRQQAALVGVDVTPSRVSVMELYRDGGRIGVAGFGVAWRDRHADVVRAIREAVQQSRTCLQRAATALSHASVTMRRIQLDAELSGEEIEAQILVDAEGYFGLSTERIYFDFAVHRAAENGVDAFQQDVCVVAARREHVDHHVTTLTRAGLGVSVVDVNSFALVNAIGLFDEDLLGVCSVVAIATVNAGLLLFVVVRDREVIYAREEAMNAMPNAVVQSFVRSMQLFQVEFNACVIERMVLCPACEFTREIQDEIAEVMRCPTIAVDPLGDIPCGRYVDRGALRRYASELVIASGLAMQGLSGGAEV